ITEITCDDVKIAPPWAVERVLNFGTPFQLIEQPLNDKTGVTHFLDINLLRLQGADETVQGVLYLVEDKTRDVTLRQELIAANAAKDQFLAQLSHELRSPLTPVIAMVGELEAELPDSKPVAEALEVVRRNVELEARLIDDLLDVTRISKGKLQLSFEPICVHQILQRAYEICRNDIDTGIGIESEAIDKIFNAFEQGQRDITRRFGGLGLGLTISKTLIDAHGGQIHVQSAGKDQGASFFVELNTVDTPVEGDGHRED